MLVRIKIQEASIFHSALSLSQQLDHEDFNSEIFNKKCFKLVQEENKEETQEVNASLAAATGIRAGAAVALILSQLEGVSTLNEEEKPALTFLGRQHVFALLKRGFDKKKKNPCHPSHQYEALSCSDLA